MVGASPRFPPATPCHSAFVGLNSASSAPTSSTARANLYRLMDQTAESHQPIVISGKRSSAVLVAADDWQAIQETLFLLSVPGLRASIKAGMAEPLDESSEALDW